MKYLLLGILGWISCFVTFGGIGLIFTIAVGVYDREDIFIAIQEGALISTALTVIGYVLAITIPIATNILNG